MSSRSEIHPDEATVIERTHEFVAMILPCSQKAQRTPHFCVLYTNGSGNGHSSNGNGFLPDKKRMLRYDIMYDENGIPRCRLSKKYRSTTQNGQWKGHSIDNANRFASSVVRSAAELWSDRYPTVIPDRYSEDMEQQTIFFAEDNLPFRGEMYGKGPKPEHGPAHFHLKYFPNPDDEQIFFYNRMLLIKDGDNVYTVPWPYDENSRKAQFAIPHRFTGKGQAFADRHAAEALEAWQQLWKNTELEHDILDEQRASTYVDAENAEPDLEESMSAANRFFQGRSNGRTLRHR